MKDNSPLFPPPEQVKMIDKKGIHTEDPFFKSEIYKNYQKKTDPFYSSALEQKQKEDNDSFFKSDLFKKNNL